MSSTTDPNSRLCPQCGRELSAHAPKGLCPACLMKIGMDTQFGAPVDGTDAPTLSISEITELFPQLEIIDLLGKGGMGVVYKARQRQLDRFVALKLLSPQLSQDPTFAERFAREAKALAQLNHPNIVSIYDFGRTGNCFYFIMEFVDGMSLWDLEQRKKPLSAEEAFSIVPKICEALQYAHDEGVIHRDIKPANILIDKRGRVKIADFGLAKILGKAEKDFSLTQSRMTMGTPHYMAPEQTERPLEVDHRADIYSLGVVFYEMLTGELPIGRFSAPSEKVQIDVRLDNVVLRALEKEPARRYQQVSEIKQNVDGIATAPADVATSHPIETSQSKALPWIIASLAVAALVTTVAIFLSRNRSNSQHVPVSVQVPPTEAHAIFPSEPEIPNTITLDNGDAVLEGRWIPSTIAPDKYGSDYVYSPSSYTNTPTASATYFPNIKSPGDYHVEVWHSVGDNRSPQVWWVVAANGKTNSFPVNQTVRGGRWTRIVTTFFRGGTNEFVQVLNNCAPTKKEYHAMAIADGVRFVPVR